MTFIERMMQSIPPQQGAYNTNDVDAAILLLRKYAYRRRPLPEELIDTLKMIVGPDARLRLYFYERILRYSSVRRVLQNADFPDDADDGDVSDERPETIIKARPVDMVNVEFMHPEVMFR